MTTTFFFKHLALYCSSTSECICNAVAKNKNLPFPPLSYFSASFYLVLMIISPNWFNTLETMACPLIVNTVRSWMFLASHKTSCSLSREHAVYFYSSLSMRITSQFWVNIYTWIWQIEIEFWLLWGKLLCREENEVLMRMCPSLIFPIFTIAAVKEIIFNLQVHYTSPFPDCSILSHPLLFFSLHLTLCILFFSSDFFS